MRALLGSLQSSHFARQWAITVLRVMVGITFFLHGWQKVVDIGIPNVEQGFVQMGVPEAALTAPLVAYLELIGGAALIIGFATRLIAIPLAINMLVAMALVHWKNGFFAPDGVELPLVLFAGLIGLVLGGPGALAVDHIYAPTLWEPTIPLANAKPATTAEHGRRAA